MFHFPQLKENWLKKLNGSFLINQVSSCMIPYTSQITEEASCFRLSYLEYDFMIANLVTLNLAIMKLLEALLF